MNSTTSYDETIQILGYRKDRLGARIIALANLLSFEQKFGAKVKYIWPDKFEDHDMTVDGSAYPIFEQEFVDKYILQIPSSESPNFHGFNSIENVLGNCGTVQFRSRLANGAKYYSTVSARPAVFSNERGQLGLRAFHDAFKRIKFSEPIRNSINEIISSELKERPTALHIRRGDVIDREPWCHKNWISKFAPDEFYEVLIEEKQSRFFAFSDTPEAAKKFASKWPHVLSVDDKLVNAPDLSEMQRDLLELLIMSNCSEIIAPSQSAFSSVASMIANIPLKKIPYSFNEEQRVKAYDSLLDRILSDPGSFINEGEFSQSLGYSFRHALNRQKMPDLENILKAKFEDGKFYSFYTPILMISAILNGDLKLIAKLKEHAKLDKNIWADDQRICEGLYEVAEFVFGDRQKAENGFLQHYLRRHKSEPNLDSLAYFFFAESSALKDLFLVDETTFQTFSFGDHGERVFLFPRDKNLYSGNLNRAFPFWIASGDWPELNEKQQTPKNISLDPKLSEKMYPVPEELRRLEADIQKTGVGELPTGSYETALLSVMAAAFTLSGRYRRAHRILKHCKRHRKDDALVYKRFANALFLVGESKLAEQNLTRALEIRPDHIGLKIALAENWNKQKKFDECRELLEPLMETKVLPLKYFKTLEASYRAKGDRSSRKSVIEKAIEYYPSHDYIVRHWTPKVLKLK